jgi:hypothetical protein
MIVLVRNVITDDTGRRADYNGSWSLLEDRGDTMMIQVHDVADIAGPTLNAVLGLWPLEDAANAVGLRPEDLVHEAEAWAMARTEDN